MNNTVIRRARTVGVVSVAAAAVGTSCLFGSGAASAHVTATANGLKQGGYGVITLNVPNESDTNAATTELTVTIPHLKSAMPQAKPGWNVTVQKDPQSDEVVQIVWTAAPGTPGIPPAQFDQFQLAGGPLPSSPEMSLPSAQKYSDGTVVDWNQPTPANGDEPEHPAPTVKLAPKSAGGNDHGDSSDEATGSNDHADSQDDTARWLGGAGIVIGALGLGAAAGSLLTRKKGGDKS
ncbi:YcnI family copper-binding membrane protein [Jongsikchunia kroppenstedtii]|uniref:YcnI family copper-binding membrane protein n=1 Tax=Jongsikchunia kroppenstedtii TaxID=1121721 RepID=UPI00037D773E|nr:YcnI family protein [Jongsikchunia kroppenstedtii]